MMERKFRKSKIMEKIRNIKIIGKFNLMIIKIIFDIYMYIILVNIYNENIENTNIIFYFY